MDRRQTKSETDRRNHAIDISTSYELRPNQSISNLGGVPEAIFFTGDRALGVDIRDGRLLWDYRKVSNSTANIATPIVYNNRVFLSSDYGTGCALLELKPQGNGVAAQEIYFNKEMRNHHSSSVLIGDHLYGFSSSILMALNFNDGKVAWRAPLSPSEA